MAQSKIVHTAKANIETRISAAHLAMAVPAIDGASKEQAANLTEWLTNAFYNSGGERVVMRVSVVVEIERE